MKKPYITNPVARAKTSTRLVWNLFADRPWVLDVKETVQNGKEDEQGYDMFVTVVDLFSRVLKFDGCKNKLPVQIKSSDHSVKEFFRKYSKHKRFFNNVDRCHQFILCGMEEPEMVLADVVGQIVVYAKNNKMPEADVINFLEEIEDFESVDAYKKNKSLLFSRWYGTWLPPL